MRKLAEYEIVKAQIREIASDLRSEPVSDMLDPDVLESLANAQ